MDAGGANRDRYREYTMYLRQCVDRFPPESSADRVAYLRAQINAERNRFLVWEVLWLLVGVAAVVPVLMLAAVEFGVALPDDILARAKTFHLQVVSLESNTAWVVAGASALMFVIATGLAISPIIVHADALNQLESASRRLRALAKA
jgi:hypothetical protein